MLGTVLKFEKKCYKMRREKIKKPLSYYHAAWYSTHLIAIYFQFNQKAVFYNVWPMSHLWLHTFLWLNLKKNRFLISAQFGEKIATYCFLKILRALCKRQLLLIVIHIYIYFPNHFISKAYVQRQYGLIFQEPYMGFFSRKNREWSLKIYYLCKGLLFWIILLS